MRATLTELYDGHSDRAHRFRYALVAFDLVTILFVILVSFFERRPVFDTIGLIFGAGVLADLVARAWIAPSKWKFLVSPITLADIVATLSFLASALVEGLGFLRVLRTLRLLHTYQLVERLRTDLPLFRRHEQTIGATVNLVVFLFVMTGLVYATEHGRTDDIGNYLDALYFTVTALTTTGFGDITLPGTVGRLLAVVIMICGVTLFLRLATVLFRPAKVKAPCPECGLQLHDSDAVHCKHCGHTVHIETEGTV
ncbi:ion transporter [Mesobaculum littorinae]|uniref:Ion transporter n=1 Tax=Mesobaculum littorinae TaxID=2486419 RepID=A0A438AF74_9RHOB|nr:ion transporter [Mesobaculum littorinae]RVV97373.1 ion transporter [Mesobaculum littorinae]